MEKFLIIVGIFALVSSVTSFMLFKALKSNRPIGQKGIYGTPLEDSRTLRLIQIVLLVVLDAASVSGLVFFVLTYRF